MPTTSASPQPHRRPRLPRFALTLHAHRRRLGLSQGELAARLCTSLQTYQRWERGERNPHDRVRQELATACGVPLWLLDVWFPPNDVVPPLEPAFLRALGDGLWHRRCTSRISAQQLADRLGMTEARYLAVEAGQQEPTWAELPKLAAVFRCEALALLPAEGSS